MVEDPDNKLKNDKKFNLKHFRTFADAVLTSVPVYLTVLFHLKDPGDLPFCGSG